MYDSRKTASFDSVSECNSCAKCPYPKYRDKHEMREIVFDDEIKVQHTRSTESPEIRQLEIKWQIQGACAMMDEQNPLFAKAIILKEYCGYTVEEIAEILHCTVYDVRYYLRRATEIGKEYKKSITAGTTNLKAAPERLSLVP